MVIKQCTKCGKAHSDRTKMCPVCKEYFRLQKRKQAERRLSNGLCCRCGKEPHILNLTICEGCNKKELARFKRLRKDRKASNICLRCGRNETIDGRTFCNTCGIILRKYQRKHKCWKADPRKWVYEGEQI